MKEVFYPLMNFLSEKLEEDVTVISREDNNFILTIDSVDMAKKTKAKKLRLDFIDFLNQFSRKNEFTLFPEPIKFNKLNSGYEADCLIKTSNMEFLFHIYVRGDGVVGDFVSITLPESRIDEIVALFNGYNSDKEPAYLLTKSYVNWLRGTSNCDLNDDEDDDTCDNDCGCGECDLCNNDWDGDCDCDCDGNGGYDMSCDKIEGDDYD